MWIEFCTFLAVFDFTLSGGINWKNSLVWGPGLSSRVTLPVRYFTITPIDDLGRNYTGPLPNGQKIDVQITYAGDHTRTWLEVLNKHDGSHLVRYKHYDTYPEQTIHITVNGQHVADSPYRMKGPIYRENCYCPEPSVQQWFNDYECPDTYAQILEDFKSFPKIDMGKDVEKMFEKYSSQGEHSLVHYTIMDNKIYSRTRGKHVDFQMFSDNILLSLTRKVHLPDMEFVVNLGDWPLERISKSSLPVISWCGSTDTTDIILPTYDLTEATLEMMGRVSLDIFSALNASGVPWSKKKETAFFRGRDSSKERIELVKMSRKYPKLIDARLTHVFFFRDRVHEIGELVPRVSFFDFFKHKYQISMDGTVAAYRFPYLLAGNSVIFKQDSIYYEHFYRDLKPFVHYIPIKQDISDLLDKLEWAKNHDEEVQKIASNAQKYTKDMLDPKSIYCYHAKVFQEFAMRQVSEPTVYKDMKPVSQPESDCRCQKQKNRDEL